MRRLLRILLNAATVLSLLLCVGPVVLFVTVSFAGDHPEWWTRRDPDGSSVSLKLAKERVEWTRTFPVTSTHAETWDDWIVEYYSETHGNEKLALTSQRFRVNTVPIFLLGLVIPGIRLARHLRGKRAHNFGHCVTCGYDLRATPDRCPECGRATGDETSR